jgi:DNA-binding transcriptional MerR regulator
MDGQLTIGRLAAAAQVPAATIRYYEAVGLMPAPQRSQAGYRLYPRAEVRRLQLIKRAKLLGLSLPQAKDLVDQTFSGSCAHLQQRLLERIPEQLATVDAQIAELAALRHELLAVQDQLRRLEGSVLAEPVVTCENCPCMAGTEGR